MVLARNLEHRGQMLLRFGIELDQDRIDRLRDLGVTHLFVHFSNEDLDTYRGLLVHQDSPPSYEKLAELARDTVLGFIPAFAQPEHCARSSEVAESVNKIVEYTVDIIFSSRRCFELLKETRFFQAPPLRHCPAAWVLAICVGAGLHYRLPALLDLSMSCIFYDVGMLRVPPRILAKPGRLTELEFLEIKKHTFFGRRMLDGLSDFSASAAIVAFEHHEFYYGGGYPKNKRGDEMHEFSQICGLTDKFAALLTAKDYRDRFQPYQAYELLLAQTKSAVSPKVFVSFLKNVLLYPRGSMLRLSTGEIAEPVDFPLHMPTRPTVAVTHGPGGEELVGRRRVINLVDHPEIVIEGISVPMDQPRVRNAAQAPTEE